MATSLKKAKRKVWLRRAIIMVGALSITMLIIWTSGLDPYGLWRRATAPKPIPVAKAPTHPVNRAIGVTPPTPKGNDSSVSPEPLTLILVKVHLGRNATEGSAEIGVVRESPQTYQAGALLENGARLAEIYSDNVVLKKDGHSARLYLENAAPLAKVSDTAMLMVGAAKETPPPAKITSREVLTDYIRPSPVYDGETLIGYQIYPGQKSGPFTQMGLKAGDLITEIDGTPLSDPAMAWDALRQVADGSALTAVVKRNGTLEQVTLDGALITREEEAPPRQVTQAMLAPPVH
jgi:type II secretion system protein C